MSTSTSAGRLRLAVSLLPLLAPFLPICSRNLPSFENFRTVLPPLPASHTLSLPSIVMPCIDGGHSKPVPGPPQWFTRLPSGSNSSTGGAAEQQNSEIGLVMSTRPYPPTVLPALGAANRRCRRSAARRRRHAVRVA